MSVAIVPAVASATRTVYRCGLFNVGPAVLARLGGAGRWWATVIASESSIVIRLLRFMYAFLRYAFDRVQVLV